MNRGQAITILESMESDAGYRIANGHGSQAAATTESPIFDACHGIGDGHGSQAVTATVFASCFLSIIYALNGRKVAT